MSIYEDQIKWITSGEAAKLLNVSTQTVRDWTAQGKLEARVSDGGHRQYDAYEIRRVALEERGVNHYWADDAIIQLWADGHVRVLGDDLGEYNGPKPYQMPLRPRNGKEIRQRADLVATGQTQVNSKFAIETLVEAGELVAQTYLAVSAFTAGEVENLMVVNLPDVIRWLKQNAKPVTVTTIGRWESPTGEVYNQL